MYGMILDAWYGAMQRVQKNIRVLNYNFIINYVVRELIINKTLLRVSDVYFLPVREYDLSKYMYDVCSSVYRRYTVRPIELYEPPAGQTSVPIIITQKATLSAQYVGKPVS